MYKNIKNSFWAMDTSTLADLVPNILYVGLYTATIYFIEIYVLKFDLQLTSMVFSLLGVVLGLLLVFRTNTAYERWWEGRKIWGALVNAGRNLAIKLDAYIPAHDEETRKFFAIMIPNYFYAMKEHMREGVIYEEIEALDFSNNLIDDLKKYNHVPNRISSLIFARIHKLNVDRVISNEQLLTLDNVQNVLTDAVGGCERIKNTPIPDSYSKHLDRFVLLYTLLLPFGFMHDLGWWCVPTIMIVYFALEGIKTIGEEIEDPFGRDLNDLPTDSICFRIKDNINELLIRK